MKILSLGAAGSTHIRNRVKAFLRSGHDNTFLADDHFHDVEIPKVIYLKNWSAKNKFLRPFIFLKNIFLILSVLRSGNYDILHAYNPSNYLCWIASIISNKPIVVITMGGDVLFEQHKCLFWYQKILVK